MILRDLPDRERPESLRQYRAAVEVVRDDVARYKNLTRLLRRWRIVVVEASRQG